MDNQVRHPHPVRVVVARTGVSEHLLRAWERRHDAIRPARTEGGQRRYSDADVRRIRLLRDATSLGVPIREAAPLSDAELRNLIQSAVQEKESARQKLYARTESARRAAFEAVTHRNTSALREILHRGAMIHSGLTFIEGLVAPLLREMGDGWSRGLLGVAEEHLASQVFREVLGELLQEVNPTPSSFIVVATTPPGQRHEFGALLAALAAAHAGWHALYPGPDLPVEEIVRLGGREGVRAVALSVVLPRRREEAEEELRSLRNGLSPEVLLQVGGNPAIQKLGAQVEGVGTPATFTDFAERLRRVAGFQEIEG